MDNRHLFYVEILVYPDYRDSFHSIMVEHSKNTLKNEMKDNQKCLLVIKKNEKIQRNEKCPATGKKYKHCCGAL